MNIYKYENKLIVNSNNKLHLYSAFNKPKVTLYSKGKKNRKQIHITWSWGNKKNISTRKSDRARRRVIIQELSKVARSNAVESFKGEKKPFIYFIYFIT